MPQILQMSQLSEIRGSNTVLVGGAFDILHPGHTEFLTRAKDLGNTLIVLLESDKKIKELKGEGRPVNSQAVRASNLSKLPFLSYILQLNYLETDLDYEKLVKKIEPDIIALTAEDRLFDWERESKIRIIRVMDKVPHYSTTRIILENNQSLRGTK